MLTTAHCYQRSEQLWVSRYLLSLIPTLIRTALTVIPGNDDAIRAVSLCTGAVAATVKKAVLRIWLPRAEESFVEAGGNKA